VQKTDTSLSIIDLILKADFVVLAIMGVLILASIVSWAIIIERQFYLKKLQRNFKGFETTFWSGVTLEQIQKNLTHKNDSPIERVFVHIMNERDRCLRDNYSFSFIKERITDITDLSLQRESDTLEGHTSFLATVGSVAPFIGLFGTVWGIMHSFTAIANTNNTSLAVVAPGIAEALFVTAMGLAAAIPAVIGYNKINGAIDHYYNNISLFSDEIKAIIIKHLYKTAKH